MGEATFAPFRADDSVLWADVRVADQHLQYEQPSASETLHYVTIDAPGVGRVWVALLDDCAPAPTRARAKTKPRACVIIARPETPAHPSSFRVAFRRDSLEPEPLRPAVATRPAVTKSDNSKLQARSKTASLNTKR
jgi:hypothetical protein